MNGRGYSARKAKIFSIIGNKKIIPLITSLQLLVETSNQKSDQVINIFQIT